MEKKKTIRIMAAVLMLLCCFGVAAALYLHSDHQAPELKLLDSLEVEYGHPVSMYELVDRVDDDSKFSLSVASDQGTLTEDRKSLVFPGVGSYPVQVTAKDAHGNKATETIVVQVVDTTPPELTAEEFKVYVGKELKYQEHVTAVDAVDGDLSGSIKFGAGKVDLNKPGRYRVTYSVKDKAGNSASISSYVEVEYPPAKKIKLSREELWLAGNEYEQLKAKVSPEDWHGEVEWSSSDPDVATVSDGLVVWTGSGECVITAKAGKKKAECVVHCEGTSASDVWLSQHTLNLGEKETFQLTAEVLPSNWNGSVTWESSNPLVADVDETGLVTWINGGECTITVYADGCSDSCQVNCKAITIHDILDDLFGGDTDQGEEPEEEPDEESPLRGFDLPWMED